jgi:L-threonylcarbamoyladenylate synthase
VTGPAPRLLRPGLIGPAELESLIGPVLSATAEDGGAGPPRSPGLLGRHYAPRTPLECVSGNARLRVAALVAARERVAWLTFADMPDDCGNALVVRLPNDPAAVANQLYAVLHRLDELGLDRIVVEWPPETPQWLAVRDRLRRAALE